jgi:hypothetical protein
MTLSPRRPQGPGWVRLPLPMWAACDAPHEFWQHESGVCAVSVAAITTDQTGVGEHVIFNVALSVLGRRPCTEAETLWALAEFRFLEQAATIH